MCLPSDVQEIWATLTGPVMNGVEFPLVSTTCNSVHEPPSFSFVKSRGTASTYATCVPSGDMTASVTKRSLATCCGVHSVSWAKQVADDNKNTNEKRSERIDTSEC